MEITVYSVIAVVTAIVTYILGFIVKKFDIIESNYIPIQNTIIGIIAGIICYMLKVDGMFDLGTSLIVCLSSAFAAGGIYDLTKTESRD